MCHVMAYLVVSGALRQEGSLPSQEDIIVSLEREERECGLHRGTGRLLLEPRYIGLLGGVQGRHVLVIPGREGGLTWRGNMEGLTWRGG